MFYVSLPNILIWSLSVLFLRVKCQTSQTVQTAVYPCSPELLQFRQVLTSSERDPSLAECLVRCTIHQGCEASVLQTYAVGPSRCATLGPVLRNLTMKEMPVSLESSLTCRTLLVDYTCLNGGTLRFGICACPNDFVGERCERPRPSTWLVREWIPVVTSTGTAHYTIHDSDINDILDYSDAKVKVKSQEYSASLLISPLWTYKFHSGSRAVSHLLLEKSHWDKLVPGGKRTLRYFQEDGKTQNMDFDGTRGNYVHTETLLAYQFLATPTTSYPEVISNDASNNAALKAVLEEGCRISRSNFARDTNPAIVLQDTMRHVNMYRSSYIKLPPKWHCQKHKLGEDAWMLRQEMTTGVPYGLKTYASLERSYDPRWLPVEISSSNQAFVKARGYIMQGQQIRVKAGSNYHDAIDVIRVGSNVWFVLSPYMSATGSVPYTEDDDLMVKSIVSLDGARNLCTHVMESEDISSYDVQSGVPVKFFTDARLYTPVFSVYSNSSVAHGTLGDLGQRILSGLDVRLLLQWTNQNKDRLLGTQLNTVKDDGKVSSESTITWRLDDPDSPDLRLSTLCDFEYVLATTDGYVEVATFNVWSPVQVRQETDILITWFTG